MVPHAKKMERRLLYREKYHRIDLMEGNLADGEIEGQQCVFLIDSGTTNNIIFVSHAERLGLLTGNERKQNICINFWKGTRSQQVISLEQVEVTLGGCWKIKIPFLVLPKEMEKRYRKDMVIIGFPVLRRGRMFQAYWSATGASKLYIRQLQRLQQSTRFRQSAQLGFYVLREGIRLPTMVVVDTGATNFYITKGLIRESKRSVVPRHVSLNLGDDVFMESRMQVRPSYTKFFTLGRHLLYKYDAILDYGNTSVTFKVGGKYQRIFLREKKV